MLPAALRVLLPTPTAVTRAAAGGQAVVLLASGADRLRRHARVLRHLPRRSSASASTLTPLSRGVRTVFGWHRPLVGFAGLMAAWGGAAGVAARLDRRRLDGAPVWVKPIKFTISLGTYTITLAWMLSMVTKPSLRRVGWWAGAVGAAACTVEIAVITLQAARGRRSHFNVATPLDSRLYLLTGLMLPGIYGVILVIGVLLTVFSRSVGDRSLVWALRSGLVIGVSGLTVGFAMGRPTPAQRAELRPSMVGSHSVGGDDPSGGLPFLGWNTAARRSPRRPLHRHARSPRAAPARARPSRGRGGQGPGGHPGAGRPRLRCHVGRHHRHGSPAGAPRATGDPPGRRHRRFARRDGGPGVLRRGCDPTARASCRLGRARGTGGWCRRPPARRLPGSTRWPTRWPPARRRRARRRLARSTASTSSGPAASIAPGASSASTVGSTTARPSREGALTR